MFRQLLKMLIALVMVYLIYIIAIGLSAEFMPTGRVVMEGYAEARGEHLRNNLDELDPYISKRYAARLWDGSEFREGNMIVWLDKENVFTADQNYKGASGGVIEILEDPALQGMKIRIWDKTIVDFLEIYSTESGHNFNLETSAGNLSVVVPIGKHFVIRGNVRSTTKGSYDMGAIDKYWRNTYTLDLNAIRDGNITENLYVGWSILNTSGDSVTVADLSDLNEFIDQPLTTTSSPTFAGLTIDGNLSANLFYGEMHIADDLYPYIVAIADANVYYPFLDLNAGSLNGFSYSDGNLTAVNAGTYKIDYSISFGGGGNNTYDVSIGKNHVEQHNCYLHRKLGTGGDVGNAGGSCLVSLAANDKIVFLVEDETTPTKNMSVWAANLTILRIGD